MDGTEIVVANPSRVVPKRNKRSTRNDYEDICVAKHTRMKSSDTGCRSGSDMGLLVETIKQECDDQLSNNFRNYIIQQTSEYNAASDDDINDSMCTIGTSEQKTPRTSYTRKLYEIMAGMVVYKSHKDQVTVSDVTELIGKGFTAACPVNSRTVREVLKKSVYMEKVEPNGNKHRLYFRFLERLYSDFLLVVDSFVDEHPDEASKFGIHKGFDLPSPKASAEPVYDVDVNVAKNTPKSSRRGVTVNPRAGVRGKKSIDKCDGKQKKYAPPRRKGTTINHSVSGESTDNPQQADDEIHVGGNRQFGNISEVHKRAASNISVELNPRINESSKVPATRANGVRKRGRTVAHASIEKAIEKAPPAKIVRKERGRTCNIVPTKPTVDPKVEVEHWNSVNNNTGEDMLSPTDPAHQCNNVYLNSVARSESLDDDGYLIDRSLPGGALQDNNLVINMSRTQYHDPILGIESTPVYEDVPIVEDSGYAQERQRITEPNEAAYGECYGFNDNGDVLPAHFIQPCSRYGEGQQFVYDNSLEADSQREDNHEVKDQLKRMENAIEEGLRLIREQCSELSKRQETLSTLIESGQEKTQSVANGKGREILGKVERLGLTLENHFGATKRDNDKILELIQKRNRSTSEDDAAQNDSTKIFAHRNGEKYKVLTTLGKGSFGFVYEVLDPANRKWALKASPVSRLTRNMMSTENEFYGRVEMCKIEDRSPFISIPHMIFTARFEGCEYRCERLSLHKIDLYEALFADNLHFDSLQILQMIQQISHALSYVHALGFIHSDIKPDNIMFAEYDIITKSNKKFVRHINVRLIDYNVVIKSDRQAFVFTGQSVPYRAPEMALEMPCDDKIDVWSLGLVAVQMLHIPEHGFGLVNDEEVAGLSTEQKNAIILGEVTHRIGPIPPEMSAMSRFPAFRRMNVFPRRLPRRTQPDMTLTDVCRRLSDDFINIKLKEVLRCALSVSVHRRPKASDLVRDLRSLAICPTPSAQPSH